MNASHGMLLLRNKSGLNIFVVHARNGAFLITHRCALIKKFHRLHQNSTFVTGSVTGKT